MKTKESLDVFKKYYLKEFTFFDGENDITFNIVGIDFEKQLIEVAITNLGRISVVEYDLKQDKNGNFYYEYGCTYKKIAVNDFETIND